MKFVKQLLPVTVAAAIAVLLAVPALAGHHEGGAEGKSCPMSMKSGMSGCGRGGAMNGPCGRQGMGCKSHGGSKCPIVSKFCQKACWIMKHREDLGLTSEQVAKIKALDLDVKKNAIRGMAEMKIFGLEMRERLCQETLDVEAIESMIDSGMANMAMGAKATVKAYAELKGVLTEEQKAKAKELKETACSTHKH